MNITIISDQTSGTLFNLNSNSDFDIETYRNTSSCHISNKTDVFIVDNSRAARLDFRAARELRTKSRGGIIMIGPKASPDDLIIALELGADEYITPPINCRELSARIRNLGRWSRLSSSTLQTLPTTQDLSHSSISKAETASQLSSETIAEINSDSISPEKTAGGQIIEFAGRRLDRVRQMVKSETGDWIKLAKKEFALLNIFLNTPNEILPREQLLEQLYNREWHPADRSVDVMIGKLRKKLDDHNKERGLITTVYGVGYVFASDN